MSFSISLLKTLDATVGPLLMKILSAPVVATFPDQINSFLVIRPGGIGDAVLLFPMLYALNKKYPDAVITILSERRNAAAFELSEISFNVLRYDKPADILKVLYGRYDVVIDSEQSHYLSAFITHIVTSSIKIGFGTNIRSKLFTHVIPYSQEDYEVESFLHLLEPFGIYQNNHQKKFIAISDVLLSEIKSKLELSGRSNFISIFPGASIDERKWGAERFHELAMKLYNLGYFTLVIGGKSEKSIGDTIVSGAIGLNLAGETTLAGSAAVIESSMILVTTDSGMLHIAVGLDKPTISLFGPGRQKKWGPNDEKHTIINKQLSCSPCTTFGSTPKCSFGGRCMGEISVDEVFNAVTMLLTLTGGMKNLCCKKDWIEIKN